AKGQRDARLSHDIHSHAGERGSGRKPEFPATSYMYSDLRQPRCGTRTGRASAATSIEVAAALRAIEHRAEAPAIGVVALDDLHAEPGRIAIRFGAAVLDHAH